MILEAGKYSRKQGMDPSSIVAGRHGFLVIRRKLPENYLTIKRRKKKNPTK